MLWHLYLMAGMYLMAGTMHFLKPKMYGAIMPSYIPKKRAMVFWSGIAEITCSLGLLFDVTRSIALLGIIVMLLLFFTVHIDMLSNKKFDKPHLKGILLLRLPLQLGLIYWAYYYL